MSIVVNNKNSKNFDLNKLFQIFMERPNYYKKFVRKHYATFCLASDGINSNVDEDLRRYGIRLKGCNSQLMGFNSAGKIDISESFVTLKQVDNSRHLSGVLKCGNPFICPACSSKISSKRSEQLKELIEVGKENKRFYALVVLTIPHRPNQPLKELLETLFDLKRYLFQNRKFRTFKEQYGLRFVHNASEITASIKNGKSDWHPHINLVFDFDKKPDLDELTLSSIIYEIINIRVAKKYPNMRLLEPFKTKVKKRLSFKDGYVTNKKQTQVKGTVAVNYDFKEDYATKYGLAEEVSLGNLKNGQFDSSYSPFSNEKSFHPFNILDFIALLPLQKEEKIHLIGMYREYAKAYMNRRFFSFGRNSIKYYFKEYGIDLDVKREDLEVTEEEESKGDTICDIPSNLWEKAGLTSISVANMILLDRDIQVLNFIDKKIKENENRAYSKMFPENRELTKKVIGEIKTKAKERAELYEKIKKSKPIEKIAPLHEISIDGKILEKTIGVFKNPYGLSVKQLSLDKLTTYIQKLKENISNIFMSDYERECILTKLNIAQSELNVRKNI